MEYYAHTPNRETNKWHMLDKHLRDVAEAAQGYYEPNDDTGNLAYVLGLWHDLGKANSHFQAYLKAQARGESSASAPHAIWGAAFAYGLQMLQPEMWKDLALPIAGHHSQLVHGGEIGTRVAEFRAEHPDALQTMNTFLRTLLPQPPLPRVTYEQDPWKREVRLRMAFSALVDADYLDTERHFALANATPRRSYPSVVEMCDQFEGIQRAWMAGKPPSALNTLRHEVYEACWDKATAVQGFFRLTVPTGGGKTRSALAFALRHAKTHGLHRIIVAAPYTSIIDQTVDVYRGIFGAEAILEHHSQIAISDTEHESERSAQMRLATQNWDAPLIVTTTVQLFESLFSNRPGRMRKLHNIARSVIVLDEVQTLPPELLEPTVHMLRALVEKYHVTVVFATATQPAFENARALKPFQDVTVKEIVKEYPRHFAELQGRVRYMPLPVLPGWDDLAEHIAAHQQIMVIVNTRKDAIELLHRLPSTNMFHLSTLLCGAHRRAVLRTIKGRLEQGLPVRLVSTQVVEAGVDISFPTVWRAIGPLDRIAQAAGRCNREAGPEPGQVVIFETPGGRMPRGSYRVGMEEAQRLLKRDGPEALHNPDIYREYFGSLFNQVKLDKWDIQADRETLNFPTVAEKYRLIEETDGVVVPYEDGFARLREWRRKPNRETWQALQPYLVSFPRYETQALVRSGYLTAITDDLYRCDEYDSELLGVAQLLHELGESKFWIV